MEKPDQRIINRTLDNTASPEEAHKVIQWFATPEGSDYLAALIDRDWEQLNPEEADRYAERVIPSEEMYRYIQSRIRRQRKKRILFRVAVVLIPVLLLFGQFWYINRQIPLFVDAGYEEICVPKGERIQLLFQDGSRATLNSGTRIRYPHRFGLFERRIELEGEAFFEVTPNSNRPFIVDLDAIDINVVGTSFNVKAYVTDPDFFVTLETGKILLTSHSATLGYMEPGEKGVYNRKNGTFQISKSGNIQAHSAWKQKQIVFNNTSMSEVMETLSRWYDVEFSVADSSVLRYEYALVSKNPSLRHILRELAKITPVRFTKKGNVIVVEEKK